MGANECGGAKRYGGTQKRAKGRYKWSCRDMIMVNGRENYPKILIWLVMVCEGHGWAQMITNESVRVHMMSVLGRGDTKRRKEGSLMGV